MSLKKQVFCGVVLEEEDSLSLADVSQACSVHAEWVVTLVEEGVIEPSGDYEKGWRFDGECLKRARKVRRLEQDLGVNIAGSALIVELLDEVEMLRKKVELLER